MHGWPPAKPLQQLLKGRYWRRYCIAGRRTPVVTAVLCPVTVQVVRALLGSPSRSRATGSKGTTTAIATSTTTATVLPDVAVAAITAADPTAAAVVRVVIVAVDVASAGAWGRTTAEIPRA